MSACRLTPDQRRKAIETYTALHEGRKPSQILCEPVRRSKPARRLGRATEIQYKKLVPDGHHSYHHPWAEQAQPSLYLDGDGLPLLVAGRYETTRRGIEDRVTPGMPTVRYLKHPYVARERLPRPPKLLTTLGRIEWIRYKGQDGSVHTLRWDARRAPLVAHDERGDLHVLPPVTEGAEDTMARSKSRRSRSRRSRARHSHAGMMMDNPSRKHPRRRHRARRNPSAYANPVTRHSGGKMSGSKAGRLALATVLVSAVGTLEIAGVNILLAKFAPTLTGLTRSLTKIGVGLLGGIGLAAVIPAKGEAYMAIPSGFAIGGVLDGFSELYNQYVMPSVNAMLNPPAATTAPSAQAMLPGGVPLGYVGYSPAACGVGAR